MTTSNSSIAFLFPGQGSQAVGMGKDLAAKYRVARQTFEEADETLGFKLSELCFEGPEEKLKLTENTQPAILTASVAVWRVLQEKCLQPNFLAGHSLGEYSAHVAAGTLPLADALRTVRNRGKYMQEAVPVGVGAMAAILGMSIGNVTEVAAASAQEEVCQPANINSPEQIVISGHAGAVERAILLATERKAKKAVRLPVSAPFHCSLMQPAQDRLAHDLGRAEFPESIVPSGLQRGCDAGHLRRGRPRSAHSPGHRHGAYREPSVRLLINAGVSLFIEVGPGKVLWGLMRQIDRSKPSLAVGEEASLRKALEQIAAMAA